MNRSEGMGYNPAEAESSNTRANAINFVEDVLRQKRAAAELKNKPLAENAKEHGKFYNATVDLQAARDAYEAKRTLDAIESGQHADQLVKNVLESELAKRQDLLGKLSKMEKDDFSREMQTGQMDLKRIVQEGWSTTAKGPAADALKGEIELLQKYIDSLEV